MYISCKYCISSNNVDHRNCDCYIILLSRHADGMFTSAYTTALKEKATKEYLENVLGKLRKFLEKELGEGDLPLISPL